MNRKMGFGAIVLLFGVMIFGCDTEVVDRTPSLVVATELRANGSIHITWNAVSGASSYEIAFRTNLDNPSVRRNVGTSTISTFTHSSPPFTVDVITLYYFVRAHGSNTASDGTVRRWTSGWSIPGSVHR